MFGIPFTFVSWDIQDAFIWTFYGIEFTHDFGIYMAGEKYSCIEVDLSRQELNAFDETGANKIAMQEIKVQAI